ncbi:Amt family ammonium transporter [Kitasatospora sp. MAP12-15]|uniref:ammonium transporter n=1 Tax=unclassified Kitasatospora TaxID=2633591 RepID=UPI002475F903|nr:ammonium transporter [Kitasatospora sp. MAP12-44]MDH6109648.1 Amt family ammonium transporter [Kitasatospora sp. MAP12-44]
MPTTLDTGNTAWLMASTAMVLLMTPGLAFFYGGMVKTKHVLVMLKMSFVCLAVVTLLWLAIGYSLAFGKDVGGLGLIGTPKHWFMHDIGMTSLWGSTGIPTVIFSCFQMAFAIITVALISGSIAGRATMRGWIWFAIAWTLLVYVPLAHWVFAPDGWVTAHLGALDFAGGLPVEINSGAAGLAVAIVVRKRKDFERETIRPHNLPLVVIGLALLWFGWFGFNAGSALQTGGTAPMAFLNTQLAAAGAMVGWPLIEKWKLGHVEMLGVAGAAVAGMVAITPSCGEISPLGALAVGFIAGVVCAFAINFKYKMGYDDTLDVVGVHGFGGIVGTVAIGLFATVQMSGKKGLFYGGGVDLLWRQAVAVLACASFSFAATWLIAKVIEKTVGFRADEEYEHVPGHEEELAYDDETISEIRSRLMQARVPVTVGAAGAQEVDPAVADHQLLADLREVLSRREQEK